MMQRTTATKIKPPPEPIAGLPEEGAASAAAAAAPKPPPNASTTSSNQQAASASAPAPAPAAAATRVNRSVTSAAAPAPASTPAAAAPAPPAAAPASPAAAPATNTSTAQQPQQPQRPQQPQLSEEAQTAKVLEDLRTSLQGKDFPAIIKQSFERIKDKTKPHGPQLKEMHEALLNIDLPSAYRILRMIKGRSKTATTGYTYTIQTRQQQQQTPVGPAKGLQKAMTGFTDSLRGTARSAIGSALGVTGGARTRRNKHRRSRTNKVKRRH